MNDLVRIGSETAKGGFANEDKIVNVPNELKDVIGYKKDKMIT